MISASSPFGRRPRLWHVDSAQRRDDGAQVTEAVERVERMTVPELHARWSDGGDIQILDVRGRDEWDDGHIPGSTLATYHDFTGIPDGIDTSRPIAVICASGQRSAVAASLLKRYGAEDVFHVVDGGVPEWRREGGAIEADR
jgi:rhodanese-related sulfurtransferase